MYQYNSTASLMYNAKLFCYSAILQAIQMWFIKLCS